MTNKFKAGDRVKRLTIAQHFPWFHGDTIFTVRAVESGLLTLNELGDKVYYPEKFELVEAANPAGPKDPHTTQVGGDHYKTLSIQPTDYICANGLGWCEGNIVKYITRWKQKGGVQDIEKVIHYAELLKGMQQEQS